MTRYALLALLTVGLSAPLALAQTAKEGEAETKPEGKMVENEGYQMWSKYKEGTSVTYEMVTKMGPRREMTVRTTQTLKELTDEKAVVAMENVVTMNGQEMKQPGQDITHKKMIPEAEKKEQDAKVVEKGEETIEIDGKKYKTEWRKMKEDANGMKSTTTVWISKKVPGGMVKMEMEAEGNGMTMSSTGELAEVDAKK